MLDSHSLCLLVWLLFCVGFAFVDGVVWPSVVGLVGFVAVFVCACW